MSHEKTHRAPHQPSAQRIYERLRKRSWRRWTRDGSFSIYDIHAWGRHDAYLKGIRDALTHAGVAGHDSL